MPAIIIQDEIDPVRLKSARRSFFDLPRSDGRLQGGFGVPRARLDWLKKNDSGFDQAVTQRVADMAGQNPKVPPPTFTTLHPDPTTSTAAAMPVAHFNIVIAAEGFQANELVGFASVAKKLRDAILATPPYSELTDRFNIWMVSGASAESGISKVVDESVFKDTRYNVEGRFSNGPSSWPGFMGTRHFELLYADFKVATSPIDPEEVDLYIVLCNDRIYGGHGDHDSRTLYMPAMLEEIFTDMALHELGHAIAGLADEYITTSTSLESPAFPNVGTTAQLAAGTLPWRASFRAYELDGGAIRARHKLGDPLDGDGKPAMPTELAEFLGAFWGCAFVEEPEGDDGSDQYDDPRGANYYRPAAKCRMRWTDEAYCRVCALEIGNAIKSKSPDPPAPPQPPIALPLPLPAPRRPR